MYTKIDDALINEALQISHSSDGNQLINRLLRDFVHPSMLKMNTQRQVTLPLTLCKEVQIKPNDDIEAFVYQGQITLVKKVYGVAKGILQHLEIDENMTDAQSLQTTLNA